MACVRLLRSRWITRFVGAPAMAVAVASLLVALPVPAAADSPSPVTSPAEEPSPSESPPTPSPTASSTPTPTPTPSATPTSTPSATSTPSPTATPTGSVAVVLAPSTVAPGGRVYVAASCANSGTASSPAFPTAAMTPPSSKNGVVAKVTVLGTIAQNTYPVTVKCADGGVGAARLVVRFPSGGLNTGGSGTGPGAAAGGGDGSPAAPPPANPLGLAIACAGLIAMALASAGLAHRRARRVAGAAMVGVCVAAALAVAGCGGSSSSLDVSRPHPTKIDIGAIDVHAQVVGVGLDQGYQVAIPPFDKPKETAWYQNSVVPGQQGSAMITGHVDTDAGPAIFRNLSRLKPGDMIKVTLSDGSHPTFQVYSTATYPKSDFPSERVYGASSFPALNLVTCAGQYDKAAGGYLSNLVVFSKLAS